MVKNTVSITAREYAFMADRESNLSRYGRFVANETKPIYTYGFYLPSVAEVEPEEEGAAKTYTFSWECEDIEVEDEGEENGGEPVVEQPEQPVTPNS